MAEAQKRRWAAIKGKSDAAATTKRAEPQKRTMSPEARRRVAEATRARWAAMRKAAEAAAKKPATKKRAAKTATKAVKKSAPRGKVNRQLRRTTAAKRTGKASATKMGAAGQSEQAQVIEAAVY